MSFVLITFHSKRQSCKSTCTSENLNIRNEHQNTSTISTSHWHSSREFIALSFAWSLTTACTPSLWSHYWRWEQNGGKWKHPGFAPWNLRTRGECISVVDEWTGSYPPFPAWTCPEVVSQDLHHLKIWWIAEGTHWWPVSLQRANIFYPSNSVRSHTHPDIEYNTWSINSTLTDEGNTCFVAMTRMKEV